MKNREKLEDLIVQCSMELEMDGENVICDSCGTRPISESCVAIADYLIANGVVISKKETTTQGWISVKERLPEDNDQIKFYDDGRLKFVSVIVSDKEKGVCTANRLKVEPCGIEYLDRFSTNGWRWSMGAESVTHWMPLPAPPEE